MLFADMGVLWSELVTELTVRLWLSFWLRISFSVLSRPFTLTRSA